MNNNIPHVENIFLTKNNSSSIRQMLNIIECDGKPV